MNDFTKDFRKVKAIPEVKKVIEIYNRGLITLDECLKMIWEEYHKAGLYKTMHKQANQQARAIMDNYGELYAKSLEAGENAA